MKGGDGLLFTSPVFLMLFLPVMLALYALCPMRLRRHMIWVISVAFYVFANLRRPWASLFFAVCVLFTYISARAVAALTRRASRAAGTFALVAALLPLLTCLALRAAVLAGAGQAYDILPPGSSFYLLSSVSCILDVRRGDAPEPEHFTDVLIYVTFFPVLIAGPVIKYKEFRPLPEDNLQNFAVSDVAGGIELFAVGFIKRVAVAGVLGSAYDDIIAQLGMSSDTPVSLVAAVVLVIIVIAEVYYAFAGYSDMARGLALMLGIRLRSDFGAAIFASTPAEYADAFLASLCRWTDDYIGKPLERVIPGPASLRRAVAVSLCCLFTAVWFGAGYYALLVCLPLIVLAGAEAVGGLRAFINRNLPLRMLGRLFTVITMTFFWLLVRPSDASELAARLVRLTASGTLQSYNLFITLFNPEFLSVAALMLFVGIPGVLAALSRRKATKRSRLFLNAARWCWAGLLMLVFVITVVYLLPQYPELATDPLTGITL